MTYSQIPNSWGLQGGKVFMPLDDLHLIHAKRKVADALLSERARAVGMMASRIEGLKMANGILEVENERIRGEVTRAWEAAAMCKDDLEGAEKKVRRLRPWATIGKVTVAVSAVAIVVAGVGIVKNTVTP